MSGDLAMIDLNEVYSLTDFQRNAKEHVERLARTGKPQVLTVNGKAAVVVQDAASYQRMLDEKERLETVAGIRRGIEAMKRGETRPLDAILDSLKARYE